MGNDIQILLGRKELVHFLPWVKVTTYPWNMDNNNCVKYPGLTWQQGNENEISSFLQLTYWKHERLNTPTSQQNTWTPVLNFIEIYM